ncbi:hypothetical protein F5B20DRAFT_238900 [Whalleya microplaca]|nr:hypothetical protein F5B20DRAFT_238900 [Whalleya microplaca]
MSKMPVDMSITWLTHTFRSGLFPAEIWSVISWIAFAFKLISLAFAVPILGLIIFDFCLWVWRLNRPHPDDDPRPHKVAHTSTAHKTRPAPSANSASSATPFAQDPASTQRRTAYSRHTGH